MQQPASGGTMRLLGSFGSHRPPTEHPQSITIGDWAIPSRTGSGYGHVDCPDPRRTNGANLPRPQAVTLRCPQPPCTLSSQALPSPLGQLEAPSGSTGGSDHAPPLTTIHTGLLPQDFPARLKLP